MIGLKTRWTALLIVIIFSITNVVWADSYPAAADLASVNSSVLLDPKSITIPETLGNILDAYAGSENSSAVILIQDAHGIPDAQKNIHALIEYFQKHYSIRRVALEGAAKKLDPQIFQSFPSKGDLKVVLEDYASNGELAGGTAAALSSNIQTDFHGIEDWDLYQEGLRLYLRTMQSETAVLDELKKEADALKLEKQKVYSPHLQRADEILGNFYDERANLLEVLQQLAAYKLPAAGSELALILDEASKEGAADSAVEMEVKELAKSVRAILNEAKNPGDPSASGIRMTFESEYQKFLTSQITPEAFALSMKEMLVGRTAPIDISDELKRLMKRQKRLHDIKGTRLFDDFQLYVREVKEDLFRNENERVLDQQSEKLRLLEKLAKLELNHKEWEMIKRQFASLPSFEDHFGFYRNAETRDLIFFKNLMASPKSNSILVAGGFHTEGLIRQFKEKEISYVLVMPAIPSIPDQSLYRHHMQGDVSWKNYFEVKNGKVNIYEAFVRATRDRLLGFVIPREGGGVATVAKLWRDQIVRDLSGQGRAAEAHKYTRFIDELTQSKDAKMTTGNSLMAKVEWFISGLERLESQGHLDQQYILQLLQGAALQSSVGAVLQDDFMLANLVVPDFRSEARGEAENPDTLHPRVNETISNYVGRVLNKTSIEFVDFGSGLDAVDGDGVRRPDTSYGFWLQERLSPLNISRFHAIDQTGVLTIASDGTRTFQPQILNPVDMVVIMSPYSNGFENILSQAKSLLKVDERVMLLIQHNPQDWLSLSTPTDRINRIQTVMPTAQVISLSHGMIPANFPSTRVSDGGDLDIVILEPQTRSEIRNWITNMIKNWLGIIPQSPLNPTFKKLEDSGVDFDLESLLSADRLDLDDHIRQFIVKAEAFVDFADIESDENPAVDELEDLIGAYYDKKVPNAYITAMIQVSKLGQYKSDLENLPVDAYIRSSNSGVDLDQLRDELIFLYDEIHVEPYRVNLGNLRSEVRLTPEEKSELLAQIKEDGSILQRINREYEDLELRYDPQSRDDNFFEEANRLVDEADIWMQRIKSAWDKLDPSGVGGELFEDQVRIWDLLHADLPEYRELAENADEKTFSLRFGEDYLRQVASDFGIEGFNDYESLPLSIQVEFIREGLKEKSEEILNELLDFIQTLSRSEARIDKAVEEKILQLADSVNQDRLNLLRKNNIGKEQILNLMPYHLYQASPYTLHQKVGDANLTDVDPVLVEHASVIGGGKPAVIGDMSEVDYQRLSQPENQNLLSNIGLKLLTSEPVPFLIADHEDHLQEISVRTHILFNQAALRKIFNSNRDVIANLVESSVIPFEGVEAASIEFAFLDRDADRVVESLLQAILAILASDQEDAIRIRPALILLGLLLGYPAASALSYDNPKNLTYDTVVFPGNEHHLTANREFAFQFVREDWDNGIVLETLANWRRGLNTVMQLDALLNQFLNDVIDENWPAGLREIAAPDVEPEDQGWTTLISHQPTDIAYGGPIYLRLGKDTELVLVDYEALITTYHVKVNQEVPPGTYFLINPVEPAKQFRVVRQQPVVIGSAPQNQGRFKLGDALFPSHMVVEVVSPGNLRITALSSPSRTKIRSETPSTLPQIQINVTPRLTPKKPVVQKVNWVSRFLNLIWQPSAYDKFKADARRVKPTFEGLELASGQVPEIKRSEVRMDPADDIESEPWQGDIRVGFLPADLALGKRLTVQFQRESNVIAQGSSAVAFVKDIVDAINSDSKKYELTGRIDAIDRKQIKIATTDGSFSGQWNIAELQRRDNAEARREFAAALDQVIVSRFEKEMKRLTDWMLESMRSFVRPVDPASTDILIYADAGSGSLEFRYESEVEILDLEYPVLAEESDVQRLQDALRTRLIASWDAPAPAQKKIKADQTQPKGIIPDVLPEGLTINTQKGGRRSNEDRAVVKRISVDGAKLGKGWFMAIADGHAGSEASSRIYESLVGIDERMFETILEGLIGSEHDGNIKFALRLTVSALALLVQDYNAGSTLSIVYVPDDEMKAYVATVGDSTVVTKDNNGFEKTSDDHNVVTNPAELDRFRKKLTNHPEIKATVHAAHGVTITGIDELGNDWQYSIQLSRALGDAPFNNVITSEPDIYSVDLGPESFIALTSDGIGINPENRLPGMSDPRELLRQESPAEALVDNVANRKGSDNSTAIVWYLKNRSETRVEDVARGVIRIFQEQTANPGLVSHLTMEITQTIQTGDGLRAFADTLRTLASQSENERVKTYLQNLAFAAESYIKNLKGDVAVAFNMDQSEQKSLEDALKRVLTNTDLKIHLIVTPELAQMKIDGAQIHPMRRLNPSQMTFVRNRKAIGELGVLRDAAINPDFYALTPAGLDEPALQLDDYHKSLVDKATRTLVALLLSDIVMDASLINNAGEAERIRRELNLAFFGADKIDEFTNRAIQFTDHGIEINIAMFFERLSTEISTRAEVRKAA